MSGVSFGSVCSGIEAASVAWHPLGWRAAWLSEIEKFPSAVLAHRWPEVPNLGDMMLIADKIAAREIEAPDVLVGGTPCQAFSVAGLRGSLDDKRGNLTLEFVRIANAIDDARESDGKPAASIVWENVPGVLSVKDNAFGCLLAGLAGEDMPLVAPGGGWANAGYVYGPRRTIAWRTFDAQYFGLAQRRKRVFLVASSRIGFNPDEVLFEFDGVRRDSAPSREAGQETTAGTLRCTDGGSDVDHARAGHLVPTWWDGGQLAQTLDAVLAKGQTMPEKNRFPAVLTPGFVADLCPTLCAKGNSTGGDRPPGTCVDTCESLIVVHGTQDPCTDNDVAFALGRNNGQENAIAVFPLDLRNAGRDPEKHDAMNRQGVGVGEDGDPANTVSAAFCHGVALSVSLRGREGGGTAELGDDIANCLRASGGGGDKAHVMVPMAIQAGALRENPASGPDGVRVQDHIAYTLEARAEVQAVAIQDVRGIDKNQNGKGWNDDSTAYTVDAAATQGVACLMQVRRITPREGERLQGFPDDHTLIKYGPRKKPTDAKVFEDWCKYLARGGVMTYEECAAAAADGPRYKAIGNSMAVPCMAWIGSRIDAHLRELSA